MDTKSEKNNKIKFNQVVQDVVDKLKPEIATKFDSLRVDIADLRKAIENKQQIAQPQSVQPDLANLGSMIGQSIQQGGQQQQQQQGQQQPQLNIGAILPYLLEFAKSPVGAKLLGIDAQFGHPMMDTILQMSIRNMMSSFMNQNMQAQAMNNFMMKKFMTDPKMIEEYNKVMAWSTKPIANIAETEKMPEAGLGSTKDLHGDNMGAARHESK